MRIGFLRKSLARVGNLKAKRERGPSITCINLASKDTHTGGQTHPHTLSHIHTLPPTHTLECRLHIQASALTDSRTYALKVCYKYAHYVRAKWQQRLLHTHILTHTHTLCHTHKHSDNGSIYYCILCGHISAVRILPACPCSMLLSISHYLALAQRLCAFHGLFSL